MINLLIFIPTIFDDILQQIHHLSDLHSVISFNMDVVAKLIYDEPIQVHII